LLPRLLGVDDGRVSLLTDAVQYTLSVPRVFVEILLAESSAAPDTLTSQPVKPLSALGIEVVQCLLPSSKRHRAASRTGDCSVV
jgi:hypothetical protein